MGKDRRKRKKFHLTSENKSKTGHDKEQTSVTPMETTKLPVTPPKDNLFAGINIDLNNLTKLETTDTDLQSVKSFKSTKSEGNSKILPKKDKIKLRRDMLLKKLDTVNQMKKTLKIREKRKNIAIIGDTNPLRDALPSLESLLKTRSKQTKTKSERIPIKKAVQKSNRRKKEVVQGVQIMKNALKNEKFKSNPFAAISQHINAIVQQESLSKKKNQ